MAKRARSIRRLVMVNVVVAVVVLTVLLTVTGSLLYYRSLVAQSNASRLENLEAIGRNIDSTTERIEYCAASLAASSQLSALLLKAPERVTGWETDTERQRYHHQLRTVNAMLSELTSLCPIYAMGVCYHDGRMQFYKGIIRDDLYDLTPVKETIARVRAEPDRIRYTDVLSVGTRRLVGMVRTLRDPATLSAYAEMVLLVETSLLESGFSGSAGNDRRLYLLSESGDIMLSNAAGAPDSIVELGATPEQMGSAYGIIDRAGGRGRRMLYTRLHNNAWTLAELDDSRETMASVLRNAMVQPVVALVCLGLSLLLVFRTAFRIERPIHDLIGDMQLVEEASLTEVKEQTDIIEVHALSRHMNRMIVRLREAMETIYQKDIRQTEAELYSLQAQINPHFFYNTLEVINMMLLVREQYDLSDLVVDLADIMRFNVARKQLSVPLRNEIDMIAKYLAIMKARFGDRFSYQLANDPDTLDCPVVKLLIQPIVENAVLHGVENTEGTCRVEVRSHLEEEMLVIEVEDDGVGIDPDVAQAINEGTYKGAYGRHSGIGMRNILQRIKLYYGDACGLTICPLPERGTLAKVVLPRAIPNLEHKEEEA